MLSTEVHMQCVLGSIAPCVGFAVLCFAGLIGVLQLQNFYLLCKIPTQRTDNCRRVPAGCMH